ARTLRFSTPRGARRARPPFPTRRSSDLLQRGLLRTALESVRVGGVVGYATCSPHLAETRAVVGDLLKQFPDTELVDARPLLPDRSEEHTSELQSRENLVCRLLLEKKKRH